MIEGKTREETIRLTAQALGVSELEAEFIVAMEQGEIAGDVEVTEDKARLLPVLVVHTILLSSLDKVSY